MKIMYFNNERLTEVRNMCKLSQAQVADALGIERSTFAKYENGNAVPSYRALSRIANLFQVTPSWFLYETDNELNSDPVPVISNAMIDERKIVDIHKDERAVVALYRSLKALGKAEEAIVYLKELAFTTNREFEKMYD